MPVPRYAISYTPPPDSPLARFGAGVLGYDCYDALDAPFRPIEGIEPAILRLMTVEPRRGGFHAALVDPFLLGDSDEASLVAEAGRLAETRSVIPIGSFAVAAHDRHVVLRPAEQPAPLAELAQACREAFALFGAAPSLYGPEDFRFHMILAGPIPNGELKPVKKALAAAFDPMAADRHEIDAISLMRQDDGKRFHVVERWRLTGR